MGKAPCPEDLGKKVSFLNSFGEKHDEAHHQANQNRPTFGPGSKQLIPAHQIMFPAVGVSGPAVELNLGAYVGTVVLKPGHEIRSPAAKDNYATRRDFCPRPWKSLSP
jgi:hypothetical protein